MFRGSTRARTSSCIAPYKGFIQPRLVAVEQDGAIVDVRIEPMEDFVEWMLESEQKYSFLPVSN